ncbi:YopX family protein [Alistipes timonensis]|uniref:YopX family protein n=1 Tax=Alistipes timonensis TaxID=1465754 RepID=UPI00266F0375|nr:YopX family protein [Alistipes timonensis]
MRTIKFRGKRLDNGEWVVGHLGIMWNEWHIFGWDDTNTAYPVNPATIGQYTGLKDDKNKEIYDGDIVQDEYEGVAKVCFDSYSWQLIYGIGDNGDQVQSFEELDGLRIAIIGNIHDNPELIKIE